MPITHKNIRYLQKILVFVLILLCITYVVRQSGIRNYIVGEEGWRQRIAKNKLTEEEFTKVMCEAINENLAGAEVNIKGPLEISISTGEIDFECYLGNIWLQCKDQPSFRLESCETYLKALIDSIRAGGDVEYAIEPNEIVPVLKDHLYVQQLCEQANDVNIIVAEPFIADIFLVYAVDLGDSTMLLDVAGLKGLDIPIKKLRKLAIDNLKRKTQEIRRYGDGPVYMLTAGGTFEASLLLVDEIWEQQEDSVPGYLVAGIPCRDTLIYTGSQSAEGIERLRQAVKELYETGGYAISKTLVVRQKGKWELFEEHVSDNNNQPVDNNNI